VHLHHLEILRFDNLLDQTISSYKNKTEYYAVSIVLVEGLIEDFNEMTTMFCILPSIAH
jgi:hypothetical protein